MPNKQDKNRPADDKIVKDINSVPKMLNNEGNDNVDESKRPAKGGRHDANSVQDGGQDVGSAAGSH
ncbi:MAG: hypothetical protein JWQ14_2379 [Adhaeribacter sp.]|nr:hypothetical protein [Adhaeribacter sp.]